jgi:hypothetical protein
MVVAIYAILVFASLQPLQRSTGQQETKVRDIGHD